jgi:hypothetical protein
MGDEIVRSEGVTSVVFSFGRFQPPTIGHRELIGGLETLAATEKADGIVFVSMKQNEKAKYLASKKGQEILKGEFETTDANENPLDVGTKLEVLRKQYPATTVKFYPGHTIFSIVDRLRSAGYTSLKMAVGSDRVETFSKLMGKTTRKANNKNKTPFAPVTVVPLGAPRNASKLKACTPGIREPFQMSGSQMRCAAVQGREEDFSVGVKIGGMTDADVKGLMNTIRVELGYPAVAGGGGRSRRQTRRRKSKK